MLPLKRLVRWGSGVSKQPRFETQYPKYTGLMERAEALVHSAELMLCFPEQELECVANELSEVLMRFRDECAEQIPFRHLRPGAGPFDFLHAAVQAKRPELSENRKLRRLSEQQLMLVLAYGEGTSSIIWLASARYGADQGAPSHEVKSELEDVDYLLLSGGRAIAFAEALTTKGSSENTRA